MSLTTYTFTGEDLQARAQSDVLNQFKRSQVFMDTLGAIVKEVQALQTAIKDTINKRQPAAAVDTQLDVIGRIVGQARDVFSGNSSDWMFVDIAPTVDTGLAWVPGASSGPAEAADNATYRMMIEAKIKRNFSRHGAVPELQAVAKAAFNINIGFERTGPMQVKLVVPIGTSLEIINYLLSYRSNKKYEYAYLMPYPETLIIKGIRYA